MIWFKNKEGKNWM